MNHLLNITKKELRELLTPGSIVSVVVVVILFMAIGTMMGSEVEDITSPTKIGVINGDDGGEWSDFALASIYNYYEIQYDLSYEEASEYIIIMDSPYDDSSKILTEMQSNGLTTAFSIAPGFTYNINTQTKGALTEYYVFENQGIMGSASSSISSVIVVWISQSISNKLVSDVTDPDTSNFMLNPIQTSKPNTYVNGEIHEGVTPFEISSAVMSQTLMVPIIIMIVIVMIGSIVISSMGNEKENKTLETLLTMPVKRTTIVSGKLIASAVVGLVFGLAYMVGMVFYMGGMTSSLGGINLEDIGLSLGIIDWLIIGMMIFLGIFCALGLCMILGAFVKNYKTAQTMTLPISVLAMIPMFVTMFLSWEALPGVLQVAMFAIPFTHPMMVMENLLFGNYELVLAGLIYLLIFTVATIMLTVKVYKSDILLTGIGQTKIAKAFSRKK